MSKVKVLTFGVSKWFWSRKNTQIQFNSCTHMANITKNIVWKFRTPRSKVKVTRGHWSVFLLCSYVKQWLVILTFVEVRTLNKELRCSSPYTLILRCRILRHSPKVKVIAIWNTDFQRCRTQTQPKNMLRCYGKEYWYSVINYTSLNGRFYLKVTKKVKVITI